VTSTTAGQNAAWPAPPPQRGPAIPVVFAAQARRRWPTTPPTQGAAGLEQYEYADSDMAALYRQQSGWLPATSVRHEAAILRAVHDAGLPAPEPVAADADEHPAILMTRLPGRLDATPADPEGWLRQIAVMAVRVHDVQVAARPFEARIDAAAFTTNGWRQRTRSLIPTSAGTPVIPASATHPAVWEAASASCGSRHLSPLPAPFTATSSPSICSGGAVS
jgi:aminoglycoside phosphotransferase (APT) family kinase protein